MLNEITSTRYEKKQITLAGMTTDSSYICIMSYKELTMPHNNDIERELNLY